LTAGQHHVRTADDLSMAHPLRSRVLVGAIGLALLPLAATADADKPVDKPKPPTSNAGGNGNGNAFGHAIAPGDAGAVAPPAGLPAAPGGKPDKPAKPGKSPKGADPAAGATTLPDAAAHGGSAGRDSAPAGDPVNTQLGKTVGATPSSGSVLVKVPGTGRYTRLAADAPLPVGSVVDARKGSVEIGSETSTGVEQHAVVGGAIFAVRQDRSQKGTTDLVLQGGDFSVCRTARAGVARSAARRRRSTDVVRGLWGSGKGRFRTRGRYATASVRGTHWITVDRCRSTTVRVVEGVVDVRDDASGTTVAVRAGQRRVVRRPRATP
jgi:hypothetical protein